MKELPEDQYLGDGVYALMDGYQIWLYLRWQGSQERMIALNAEVFQALVNYAARAGFRFAMPRMEDER